MSEQTPEQVLELALREQQQRRAHEREQARERRLRGATNWRYLFAGLLLTLLGIIALVPGQPLNARMYAVVHGICAQQHNELLGGVQLPLCARNTGIYGGFLVTVLYLLLIGKGRAAKLPPFGVSLALGLLVVVMALDGFNSLLRDLGVATPYTPANLLRTLTGIGAGVAMGTFIPLILNSTLRHNARREQAILSGWLDLGGALAAALLVLVIVYGDLTWGYWLVAALSFFGITGVLFMVNLLVIALLLGYEGVVTRWSQLARPATYALLVTALMLIATSTLRFWLEGQGALTL
jgi:uncharacterized membrane protein